jgi:hypothetical protein
MIIKPRLSRWTLFLLSFSAVNLVYAYAEPAKNDYLQQYRDEIKQAEANASQAVLDTLKSNSDSDDINAKQTQPSPEPVAPPSGHSNKAKAFSPSTGSTNTAPTNTNNPWLKPNPWAKQTPTIWEKNAKINPYSNAPIPGPTPPANASANLAIPSPPNIFAPSQATLKPNQPKSNANP